MLASNSFPRLLALIVPLLAFSAAGRLGANEPLVTADQIQSAPEEQRTRIVGCVAATLADDSRLAARWKREAEEWSDSRRAAVEASIDHIEAQAKTVRRAMRAAERASDESWNEARDRLAEAFGAYTTAMERLHACCETDTAPPAHAGRDSVAKARWRGSQKPAAQTAGLR